jgi:hypothetical protein
MLAGATMLAPKAGREALPEPRIEMAAPGTRGLENAVTAWYPAVLGENSRDIGSFRPTMSIRPAFTDSVGHRVLQSPHA